MRDKQKRKTTQQSYRQTRTERKKKRRERENVYLIPTKLNFTDI